jgi:hypothetical protein
VVQQTRVVQQHVFAVLLLHDCYVCVEKRIPEIKLHLCRFIYDDNNADQLTKQWLWRVF